MDTLAPSRQEVLALQRRCQAEKTCLHPDAGRETCGGGFIEAHSVQEARLRRIAERGHVLRWGGGLTVLDKSGGRFLPQLIGVRKASVFTGFCSTHDTRAFRRIDTEDILPDTEQAFLLAYRALSREVIVTAGDVAFYEELYRVWGKEAGWEAELNKVKAWRRLEEACNRRIWYDYWHKRYQTALLDSAYGQVGFLAFSFHSVPEFCCSGWVFPKYDFQGNGIQNEPYPTTIHEAVALTVVPQGDGGIAVLSWVGSPNGGASRFAESLDDVPLARIPDALLRFALTKFENIYMSPEWWKGLPDAVRVKLTDRYQTFLDGRSETYRLLLDDGVPGFHWDPAEKVSHPVSAVIQ